VPPRRELARDRSHGCPFAAKLAIATCEPGGGRTAWN
jgi:hypothetical protein